MFDSTRLWTLAFTNIELFELHIISCCSFTTAQLVTKKRTLKCSAPFKQEETCGERLQNAWLVFPPPHDAHIPHWVQETPAKLCIQALSTCFISSSPSPGQEYKSQKAEPLWNISLANCCNFPSVFSLDGFARSIGDDLQHSFWIKGSWTVTQETE